MPYIKQEDRKRLDESIEKLIEYLVVQNHEGEYNYTITRLVHEFILKRGKNYATLNAAMGILECAKQELYRTVIGPYEDIKITENGNVSKLDY
jgi:hypothetical protein